MAKSHVETLTSAFANDPVINFLLPPPPFQKSALRLLMEFFVALKDCKGGLLEDLDEGHSASMVTFAPETYPISLFKILPVIFRYGLPALSVGIRPRIILRGIKILRLIESLHPKQPHWYVLIIGVNQIHQGKGYGSKLMAPLLNKADQERMAIYLESSNPKNLSFYKQLGFRIIEEIKPLQNCPPMWRMIRDPST